MLPDTYFKRNGVIYGDRSRFIAPGKWSHEFHTFKNFQKALEWKEKRDFGYDRKLISKNEAMLRGMKFKKEG